MQIDAVKKDRSYINDAGSLQIVYIMKIDIILGYFMEKLKIVNLVKKQKLGCAQAWVVPHWLV